MDLETDDTRLLPCPVVQEQAYELEKSTSLDRNTNDS